MSHWAIMAHVTYMTHSLKQRTIYSQQAYNTDTVSQQAKIIYLNKQLTLNEAHFIVK